MGGGWGVMWQQGRSLCVCVCVCVQSRVAGCCSWCSLMHWHAATALTFSNQARLQTPSHPSSVPTPLLAPAGGPGVHGHCGQRLLRCVLSALPSPSPSSHCQAAKCAAAIYLTTSFQAL